MTHRRIDASMRRCIAAPSHRYNEDMRGMDNSLNLL
jgi:hypothetical protein